MNCAECRDLLLEYALGALDAAESAELRAHLANGCAGCAQAMTEAEALVGQLALALPAVAPPPAVRHELLRRLAVEPAANAPIPKPASSSRERSWWLVPVAWAASVAISAGLAAAMANAANDQRLAAMRSRLDTLDATNQRLTKDVSEAADRNGSLAISLAKAQETIGMLRSSDLSLVSMTSSGPQPRLARARALWDKDTEHWQLIATGMTPPGKGKVFELWFITADQRKVAAGVFDVDAQGNGILTVTVPHDIGQISVAAVTDEPGLMTAPTGAIHLAGKL